MTVAASRWSGVPVDLSDALIPLYVRIDNQSQRPLRIRYDAFQLIGNNGTAVTAQPPYKIDGEGAIIEPLLLPKNYLQPGFIPAPHYRTPEGQTFVPRHPWNYDEYTPRYNLWAFPLPSEDMLEKGIPEGVLEPGGSVSGFLYFPKLPEDTQRALFEATLVNAANGKTLETIRIPLPVSS